jgi:hypothetical protein
MRFEKGVPVTKKGLCRVLESARKAVDEFSGVYNINIKKSKLIRQVDNLSKTRFLEDDKPGDKNAGTDEHDALSNSYFMSLHIIFIQCTP